MYNYQLFVKIEDVSRSKIAPSYPFDTFLADLANNMLYSLDIMIDNAEKIE
jgi:hypothetical protein